MHYRKVATLAGALACLSTAAMAQGAPKQLYNKSITLSWAQSAAMKVDGRVRPSGSTAYTRQIYVSGAGRLFVRATRDGGVTSTNRHTSKSESDPTANLTPGGGGMRFQGNRLVGVLALASDAVQAAATFDPSFGSCTLEVIMGKSGGGPIKMKLPDGAMGEAVSEVQISYPKCAISDGNVFAGR